ncbi:MAG: AbrB/MazE/SpoVT family DNA-binding domain-containing protein [Nanoarchaeota archaeon]
MKEKVRLTTTSLKGQVVIPQVIRKELKIEEGTKFAVFGRKDTIVLKKVSVPTIKDFERVTSFGRKFAKKRGIKRRDVLKND